MATGSSEAVEEIFDYLGRRRVLLTRKIAFHTADGEPRLLGISTDVTTLKGRERSLSRQTTVSPVRGVRRA